MSVQWLSAHSNVLQRNRAKTKRPTPSQMGNYRRYWASQDPGASGLRGDGQFPGAGQLLLQHDTSQIAHTSHVTHHTWLTTLKTDNVALPCNCREKSRKCWKGKPEAAHSCLWTPPGTGMKRIRCKTEIKLFLKCLSLSSFNSEEVLGLGNMLYLSMKRTTRLKNFYSI